MRVGAIVAVTVTVILVIAAGVATWLAGFFMLAVALNGFVGKPTAVDVSMYGYMILAALTALLTALLAAIITYLLAGRRKWNAAGAAALTTISGILGVGILHFACFILAVIVAVVLYG